jgi:hypothetical protein
MAQQRTYDPEIHLTPPESLEELKRVDHAAFTSEVKELVRDAENTRLRYMQKRQNRGFIALTVNLLASIAGVAGFAWFFLVEGDILKGLGCFAIAIICPLLLINWKNAPVKNYIRAHKAQFMPKLAKTLGGFKYNATGGIARNVLQQTGIVPDFDSYRHEDCFLGLYKGTKVIFSEARLYKGSRPVFEGVLVLLELPQKAFEGHTILTADKRMAEQFGKSRWGKLQAVALTSSNPEWNRFLAFSDRPDLVPTYVPEKMMKELSEAADVFGRCAISCAFMKGKYLFMTIPWREDMFEASDIDVPLPTTGHVEERRREIEKLLEVVDVFDVFTAKAA